MNEQLVVKNFGPIKDATVDFKRVTVFIGPTGGGKSTLAKLAAVFRDKDFLFGLKAKARHHLFDSSLSNYGILSYTKDKSEFEWASAQSSFYVGKNSFSLSEEKRALLGIALDNVLKYEFPEYQPGADTDNITSSSTFLEEFEIALHPEQLNKFDEVVGKFFSEAVYIPADRAFASAIEGAIFSLRRKNTALPYALENFLGLFEIARKNFPRIHLPVFDIKYNYRRGENLLELKTKETIDLAESASGIQTALPLMLVVEHLSSLKKAHSFIAEEPELNLYPTSQQDLLNWLVEKCTQGENDLTITTHSPYILSHLNLLLYAYQVAEKHPERREEVAAIVPEVSWINPKEFACYQVENGGVQSLVNDELGMIDNNELDALSGDAADAFDNLIRLSKGIAVK